MNGFRIFCTVRTSIAANEARKRFQAKACPGLDPGACPGLDPGACPGLDPGWRAGSRQENASTRESAAPFRFYRSGKEASRLVRPKNHERRLARANNVRKALVACTVSMAFSSALRSDLTASSCSDLNSIHSTELSLVINR